MASVLPAEPTYFVHPFRVAQVVISWLTLIPLGVLLLASDNPALKILGAHVALVFQLPLA